MYINEKRKEETGMVEKDTIKLLRECDAGAKMGIRSIDDVLEYVKDGELKETLSRCREKHLDLNEHMKQLLDKYGDEGKEPAAIAKGMSWIKTNVKLAVSESDATVADLITDGCNMGVKSLGRYLNEYKAADEESKDIAKRLINLEEQLAVDIRRFL